MRAFIVLSLVAVACADKLGYNYQPVGHSSSGLSFAPGAGSSGSALLSGSIGGGSLGGGSLGGLGGGSLGGLGGGSLGGLGGGSLGGLGGGSIGGPVSYSAPAAAEYSKEFYSFSAPDSEFDDPNAAQQISAAIKKNLRVVFIKAPENRGLEDAALNLARQAAEQQTAIYVLSKQADIGDLANKLNAIRSNSNQKPEVHFVKYRTPQDAANAQQAIQSQYDSLGGSSQSHNGGIAPVLNFASQAPISAPVARAPGSAYLPSSVLRRFRF